MAKAYYIPNGTKNLQTIFPTIDFNNVSEYFLELIDNEDIVIATSTLNQVCGCKDDEDRVRIHFLNYLGSIDAMNFKMINKDHEPKSDTFQKPGQYPLNKPDHSVSRFNVKSNDSYKAISTDYNEDQMDWIDELLDSPIAWMEWNGGQGQPASFIPIIISDIKSAKFKVDDRYTYEVELDFQLSHEKFIIRN